MKYIVIILLVLCSCRSSKEMESYRMNERITSELRANYERNYTDYLYSMMMAKFGSQIAITENIKETSYDSIGNVKNIIDTNRNINIDVNGDLSKNDLSVNAEKEADSTSHDIERTEDVESESMEMSEGGQDDFGKWFGIVLGVGILVGITIIFKNFK